MFIHPLFCSFIVLLPVSLSFRVLKTWVTKLKCISRMTAYLIQTKRIYAHLIRFKHIPHMNVYLI